MLLLALVAVVVVSVSTAPAPQRKRRIVIIVIRRRPRDVSNQLEMQDGDYLPSATPINGDHPLESIVMPSRSRFAREAGDEPQWLYKDDNIDRAPATGDHPFLPQYIDGIKLDPNSRYARDIQNPEVLYVMKPIEDEEQE